MTGSVLQLDFKFRFEDGSINFRGTICGETSLSRKEKENG